MKKSSSPLSTSSSGVRPSPTRSGAPVVAGPVGAAGGEGDWDVGSALKTYGLPLGTLALVGMGAVYFSKRLGDIENSVSVVRREQVRHLSETDVRMIVQQMARDGLIQLNHTPIVHGTSSGNGASNSHDNAQTTSSQSQQHALTQQQQHQALLQQQRALEDQMRQKRAEYDVYMAQQQQEMAQHVSRHEEPSSGDGGDGGDGGESLVAENPFAEISVAPLENAEEVATTWTPKSRSTQ